MKIKQLLLRACLFMLFGFGCYLPSISAYATGDNWSSAQSYTYFENHFDEINTRLNGVVINQNQLQASFEDYLQEYRDNYNIPSGTSESTWIGDNISGTYQNGNTGVADLGISQALRQAMRDWCNTYISTNTKFKYGYTWTSSQYQNYFDSSAKFNAFLTILNNNQDKYVYVENQNIYVADYELTPVFYSFSSSYNSYNVFLRYNGSNTYDFTLYTWSDSGNTFNSSHYTNNAFVNGMTNMSAGVPASQSLISYGCPVGLNTKTYIVYNSDNDADEGTAGTQDYYVTDSYNENISGSYNTTTTDIENTIDSNNINNYINNYYIQNGEYPSPTIIQIYIDDYPDNEEPSPSPSPTPTPGPDNPGGDDEDKNIWDFLSDLGDIIGNLIAGLGEILAGVLSSISSIITSLREGIPNTIGLFLEWFFPFLPTEIVALLELSILCMVIVGVIRLIRGH